MDDIRMETEPQSPMRAESGDCDAFGHLHHSRHLDYFLRAREDHLRRFYGFDLRTEAANRAKAGS